jgi:hypothetical protein
MRSRQTDPVHQTSVGRKKKTKRRCQIRDDEFVCLVRALADTSDELDGAYRFCKLVGMQVSGGARRTHKHVWKELRSDRLGYQCRDEARPTYGG